MENGIMFKDSRYSDKPKIYEFDSDYALFYKKCKNQIVTVTHIKKDLLPIINSQKIEQIIQALSCEGLLYQEGNKLIALALEESVYDVHSENQKSMKWASPFV